MNCGNQTFARDGTTDDPDCGNCKAGGVKKKPTCVCVFLVSVAVERQIALRAMVSRM